MRKIQQHRMAVSARLSKIANRLLVNSTLANPAERALKQSALHKIATALALDQARWTDCSVIETLSIISGASGKPIARFFLKRQQDAIMPLKGPFLSLSETESETLLPYILPHLTKLKTLKIDVQNVHVIKMIVKAWQGTLLYDLETLVLPYNKPNSDFYDNYIKLIDSQACSLKRVVFTVKDPTKAKQQTTIDLARGNLTLQTVINEKDIDVILWIYEFKPKFNNIPYERIEQADEMLSVSPSRKNIHVSFGNIQIQEVSDKTSPKRKVRKSPTSNITEGLNLMSVTSKPVAFQPKSIIRKRVNLHLVKQHSAESIFCKDEGTGKVEETTNITDPHHFQSNKPVAKVKPVTLMFSDELPQSSSALLSDKEQEATNHKFDEFHQCNYRSST